MLYKDLSLEKQALLTNVYLAVGRIPEDATHIDSGLIARGESLLKFVGGDEYFMLTKRWRLALGTNKAINYFPIPEDLFRKTGKVIKETSFPDFPFKLSCGDRPEVRQWLKVNGCEWQSGDDLTTNLITRKLLWVSWNKMVTEFKEHYTKELNNDVYFVEIEPIIKVTGYAIPESSKARKETIDKLNKLRDNEQVIQAEIKKLEESLK